MINIHPITEKIEQEAACARFKIEYKESNYSYGAFYGQTLIGISTFHTNGESATIKNVSASHENSDFDIKSLLIHSVCHFLNQNNVKTVCHEEI